MNDVLKAAVEAGAVSRGVGVAGGEPVTGCIALSVELLVIVFSVAVSSFSATQMLRVRRRRQRRTLDEVKRR